MAHNTPKQLVVISSTDIDLKSTGNTILFTPLTPFAVEYIFTYGVNLSGVIGAPVANFGWTAAAYNDLISGFSTFSTVTNNLNGILVITVGETQPIPANTPFRINVTAADATATNNTQKLYITGFYL